MGVISGNIQKRKQLTLYLRGKIVSVALLGHSFSEIAKALKYFDLTVKTIIKRDLICNKSHTKLRSGRPYE
jgi:hypothetical protein